ncbi:MAG: ribosome small subunit-dependent GTPase A [Cardiobacteriaceae bacterium]|nr:ribosome small subunit-dependent GTPase A [Cardiobacteriaceae bacterium]
MSGKLSHQQHRRIRAQHERRLEAADADAAIVVAHLGYEVIVSHHGELHACDWRKRSNDIAVNDRVLVRHGKDGRPVIEAVYPRERTLYKWQGRKAKPVVSHIDQLLVCIAIEPAFQTALIDRYLIAAREAGIEAAILVNKTDLADAAARAALDAQLSPYRMLGHSIFYAAVEQRLGLAALEDWLTGRETVLCGQSGVGKSSLIKQLIPDADIWIQAISQATGLGRHTTTNLRRYPLDDATALIDTPGVRGFALTHLEREQILAGYPDITAHAAHCRFADCSHHHEPDCAVQLALANGDIVRARYDSLMQLLDETP